MLNGKGAWSIASLAPRMAVTPRLCNQRRRNLHWSCRNTRVRRSLPSRRIAFLGRQGLSVTPDIRRAFVVYPGSHNRQVHEVLFPAMRNTGQEYERNFKGMTTE